MYIRKVQAFSLLMLIMSLSSLMIVHTALADNDSEDKHQGEHNSEAMLRLLNYTRLKAKATLSFLETVYGDIPEDITYAYETALSLCKLAEAAFEEGNYSECIRLSFQALKSFKTCFKSAGEILTEDVNDVIAWRGLLAELKRLEILMAKIKYTRHVFLKTFPEMESNFTEKIDLLITEAEELIAKAEERFSEGNYTGAAGLIGMANAKASQALAVLNMLVNSRLVMALRIKHYIEGAYTRFMMKAKLIVGVWGLTKTKRIMDESDEELKEIQEMVQAGELETAKLKLSRLRLKIHEIVHQLEEQSKRKKEK